MTVSTLEQMSFTNFLFMKPHALCFLGLYVTWNRDQHMTNIKPHIGAAVAQKKEQSPINRKVGGSTLASPGYMSKRAWARH